MEKTRGKQIVAERFTRSWIFTSPLQGAGLCFKAGEADVKERLHLHAWAVVSGVQGRELSKRCCWGKEQNGPKRGRGQIMGSQVCLVKELGQCPVGNGSLGTVWRVHLKGSTVWKQGVQRGQSPALEVLPLSGVSLALWTHFWNYYLSCLTHQIGNHSQKAATGNYTTLERWHLPKYTSDKCNGVCRKKGENKKNNSD